MTGRKVAKCEIGKRFEFRCSYCLTNMSLREFLKKSGVEHQKEELDYSVKRFPWSELTADEISYCVNDVLGLWEALKKKYKTDKVCVSDCPLTSTGFVRQDFKRAMRKSGEIQIVRDMSPTYEVYLAIRRAFRGGNCHANRCYTSVILDNISSWDRVSSYPDVLCNMPFPVKRFEYDDTKNIDDLLDGFPYLLCIDFYDMELRDPFYGCPYLSVHKCYNLTGAVNDNGRVVKCKTMRHWCTSVDLDIIKKQYVWSKAVIVKCYRSEYGLLPEAMREVTMDYYRKKTEWKGDDNLKAEYGRAKARLNSVY